jgi:hypothetical protein
MGGKPRSPPKHEAASSRNVSNASGYLRQRRVFMIVEKVYARSGRNFQSIWRHAVGIQSEPSHVGFGKGTFVSTTGKLMACRRRSVCEFGCEKQEGCLKFQSKLAGHAIHGCNSERASGIKVKNRTTDVSDAVQPTLDNTAYHHPRKGRCGDRSDEKEE